MSETDKIIVYLLSCAVNNIKPIIDDAKSIDLDQLYKLAKFHSVISLINISLEKIGIKDDRFHQAYKKSIRKNILLDSERNIILNEFEKNGIWYMPLKGSVLKDMYPLNGMRQMADNDILFDKTKKDKVKEIMISNGYDVKYFDRSNHDVYTKQPVLNFELHKDLFNSDYNDVFYKYYSDIKNIMKKDNNNKYGFHFKDEDFYVHITAHEWKHFNGSGTGIRSLIDCYVFLKNKNDVLDWKYIKEQLKKLDIFEFEERRRKLAMKIFSSTQIPELDLDETELLMYYLTSGTYGTYDNRIKKKLKTQSKLSFWIHSIFIPRKQMNNSVPFTSKSILLYPIGVVWRTIRVLLFKRDKVKRTIKEVNKYGK